MSRILKSRRALILLGTTAIVAIAAVAYAYLAVTGTGSGTGSVTDSRANVTLTSSSLTLANIGDKQTVTITATNTGASPEKIGALTVTAAPSTAAATAGCPSGSFTVSNITNTGNEIPAKVGSTDGSATVGHADITFTDDPAASQNACQGSGTVALTLGSS